jgi:serine/threonine-protein kinase
VAKRAGSPRLGLLARIALALVAVGILPLWLVSQQLVGINRDALQEQAKNNLSLGARTTAERIESFLRSRRNFALAAGEDPAFTEPGSGAAALALKNYFTSGHSLGLLAAAFVKDEIEVVRAQRRGDGERNNPGFAAPGGDAVVAIRQFAGPPNVRLGVPVGSGSLRLLFDGAELAKIVDDTRELGGQAEVAVVGADRQLIAGSAASVDRFPPSMLENALSGRLEAGARRDYTGPDGKSLAGAFAHVPTAGWAVLSQQPLAAAEAVARQMRRRAWLTVLGAAALILVLASLAWATLVRPLRRLAHAQRRLAGLPTGGSPGDEVQSLATSFQALERSVRDREDLGRVFLGRYQVVEIIGRGAMGTVFRGWDPKLQRAVALKTIRLDQTLDTDRRQRLVAGLISEAVTGARFSHPNILQVYDVEDLPEATFIATEFIDGMSLDFLLWLKERLEPAQVVPLAAAVARGLGVAHEHGVVHRDVKPSNILLGKEGSIKVADFGIAGLVAATAQRGQEVFGTPGYLPPETLMGGGYDRAGDLFALGVVLYQALTGKFPFGGKSAEELARRTVVGTLQPLHKVIPEVPPALASYIHRLLDKNPRKRDLDAGVLAGDLEEMSRSEGWRWSLPEIEQARDGIYSAPTEAQFLRTARLDPVGSSTGAPGAVE